MNLPSEEYSRVWFKQPEPLLKGIDAAVHGGIGRWRRRSSLLGTLTRQAEQIDLLAGEYKTMANGELARRLLDYRAVFRRGGRAVEPVLNPAMAAIREAADRTLGLRPFVVQLTGALALHRGYLAEMGTGEGKTLTAGLAAVLAGWSHHPCHIITVNDYLVQRDAEWLRPLYHFCGVRVGFVTGEMPAEKRRHGYDCDITYTTSKEVVADFLRDSLQLGAMRDPTRRLIRRLIAGKGARPDGLVLRGLHTAIVDEADSVLIDEAVTPLIISTPRKNEALREVVGLAQGIASGLDAGPDYGINIRYREIELTDGGQRKIDELCANLPGIWRGPLRRSELVKQALVAREFYRRDKQYVVESDKLMIVDEFTGRRMPMRTWRQGMHQAIEAKEGIPVTDPTETIARLSFQRFFRFYYKISGMTGTAREAAGELWTIYQLPVVSIPPNRPCVRKQLEDRIFATESGKWDAVVAEIERVHETGQPLLVGTRSVAASERLGQSLAAKGITTKILNAVRHQDEAAVVTLAGEAGGITIATNMAGRGTDIKLGRGVVALGGLRVLATERHESGRVDRQLFGRCARQGDPGVAQAFVSVEDELLRRHLPKIIHRRVDGALKGGLPGSLTLARAGFALAQRNAQRMAFKQRATVLRMDDWMEESLSFAAGEF